MRQDGSKSGPIYLYSLVIADNKFQVPVHSLLSEVHDTNFISFWLGEFLKQTKDIPKQFISDMSLVLLNAATRIFAYATLPDYIDKLFKMNVDKDYELKPDCFVRIDRNHLVKNVAKCEALKNCAAKTKEFYIRCVCLLIKSTSLDSVSEIILSVFVVCMSRSEGKLMNEDFYLYYIL